MLAQFAGTSLWFTGNAVLPELKQALQLSQYAVSLVTSALMIGFIAGTLVFALLSLADRFSPVKLFFISSLLGALSNLMIVWFAGNGVDLFIFRFMTGFFLAGIYPVGMKIAADWFEKGLGKALGFLLGALVLGTAFPHLLRNRDFELPWKTVFYFTSLFALIGGLLMISFVGDGPHRKKSGSFQWNAIGRIFRSRNWRVSALGYFGHMWELYTFWGFLPVLFEFYAAKSGLALNISLLSFLTIAFGSVGCIIGGYLSQVWGSKRVAIIALATSGICCLLSPFIFQMPQVLFLSIVFIWGFTVSPDSPQFSTLVSLYAPAELRGTALTIYNAIGFSISVLSLMFFDFIIHSEGFFGGSHAFLLLGAGALVGLPRLFNLNFSK